MGVYVTSRTMGMRATCMMNVRFVRVSVGVIVAVRVCMIVPVVVGMPMVMRVFMAVIVRVAVVRMMVNCVTVPWQLQPLVRHPAADRDDRKTRYRSEHLRDLLRHDVLEQEKGRQAQQED